MQCKSPHTFFIGVLLILGIGWGCGGKDESTVTKKPIVEVEPTVSVPPPPEHYRGVPHWMTQSQHWPAAMEWILPASGDYSHDSLLLRLTGDVMQSFLSGPKGKEHPIVCQFVLTVRPIPLDIVGRSFNIDSVIFYDPIRKKYLPKLPMLSSERHTEAGVVRTRFSNNLAVMHSPDLTEGQPLKPTVYVTSVGGKTIELEMEPLNVTFIKELKPPGPSPDSLKWGPS